MNEQEASRKLDFQQSVHYDQDVVDVFFDVEFDNERPCMSASAQVFYRGANITDLVDWDKIDNQINWKRVKEEYEDQ